MGVLTLLGAVGVKNNINSKTVMRTQKSRYEIVGKRLNSIDDIDIEFSQLSKEGLDYTRSKFIISKEVSIKKPERKKLGEFKYRESAPGCECKVKESIETVNKWSKYSYEKSSPEGLFYTLEPSIKYGKSLILQKNRLRLNIPLPEEYKKYCSFYPNSKLFSKSTDIDEPANTWLLKIRYADEKYPAKMWDIVRESKTKELIFRWNERMKSYRRENITEKEEKRLDNNIRRIEVNKDNTIIYEFELFRKKELRGENGSIEETGYHPNPFDMKLIIEDQITPKEEYIVKKFIKKGKWFNKKMVRLEARTLAYFTCSSAKGPEDMHITNSETISRIRSSIPHSINNTLGAYNYLTFVCTEARIAEELGGKRPHQ